MTYLLIVLVVHDVAGVRQVFYKIGPPRPKLRVIDLTVLELKLEVGINGDELRI